MENTPEPKPETLTEDSSESPRSNKPKLFVTAEMKADPLSRKLIFYSLFFASLAVICIGFLTYTYIQKKRAEHPAQHIEVSEKPTPLISHKLDLIHVVLKNEQDFRAEIVTECSNQAACDYIKNHTAEVRDLLIPILTNIDPNYFSTLENKKTVRKSITDQLNTLDLNGKIIQIQFNNLSIEGKPK